MLGVTERASRILLDILSGETGLVSTVSDATDPQVAVRAGFVGAEIAERSPARYPCVYVYVERLTNNMTEKFRTFSGTARLAVEVRTSQERADGLESQLHGLVERVLEVLHTHRGDWGYGVFFGGRYDVVFSPVKPGGKGYLQIARIGLDINLSID
jgi:hypothetical protein